MKQDVLLSLNVAAEFLLPPFHSPAESAYKPPLLFDAPVFGLPQCFAPN